MAAAGMMALMAASTVVSTLGTIQQGRSQAAMMNYNAKVSENEAIAARQAAAYEVTQHRRRLLETQKTVQSAPGLLTGSKMEVMLQNAEQGELDALAIQYAGSVSAARSLSQAAADRMAASAARTGSYWAAGSTLLTGGSKLAGNWPSGSGADSPLGSWDSER